MNGWAFRLDIHDWRALLRLPMRIVFRILSLGPKSTVVECGANIGVYTRIFSRSGAQVIAFEPDPVAFAELEQRLGSLPNVNVIEAAAGVSSGHARLRLHKDRADNPLEMSQGSSLLKNKPNVGADSIRVRVVDLAGFLLRCSDVAILKMDIEGFETVVIPHLIDRGALDHVDKAFVELHHSKWPALEPETQSLVARVDREGLAEKVSFDWP